MPTKFSGLPQGLVGGPVAIVAVMIFRLKSIVARFLPRSHAARRLGYLAEFRKPKAELDALYRTRLSGVYPINQPVVWITQAARSGGTLLSRLFDGHPQVHAYGHEMHFRDIWPDLDLNADPEDWFADLFPKKTVRLFRNGGEGRQFTLPPNLQRTIFLQQARGGNPVTSQRDVMNCFMTSRFNAWLDYHSAIYDGQRCVTAFTPWAITDSEAIARFFRDYPDGRLISMIRDPLDWYPSAKRHMPKKYPTIEAAVEIWRQATAAALDAKANYGDDKVRLIPFEALVKETVETITRLSSWLDIDWHESLLTPTFNGSPDAPNSVFSVQESGILKAPLSRRNMLTDDERHEIEALTGRLHRRALESCAT